MRNELSSVDREGSFQPYSDSRKPLITFTMLLTSLLISVADKSGAAAFSPMSLRRMSLDRLA